MPVMRRARPGSEASQLSSGGGYAWSEHGFAITGATLGSGTNTKE